MNFHRAVPGPRGDEPHGPISQASRRPLVVAVAIAAGALTIATVAPLGAQTSPSSSSSTTSTTALTEKGSSSDSQDPSSGDIVEQPGTTQLKDRLVNVNSGLRLLSAQVQSLNLNDTEDEFVRFTFARPVNAITDPTGFELEGYDVDTSVDSNGAQLVVGDANSVLARYPAGTDIASYTLAGADNGVVQDEARKANIPGMVALGGSSSTGATDAPQLSGIRVDNTLERVTYVFNRQLVRTNGPAASQAPAPESSDSSEAAPESTSTVPPKSSKATPKSATSGSNATAANLGFYTADGRAITAQSIVTVVDNVVTVQFDRQVENGALFFAKAGAVNDARGVANTPSSTGTSTSAPSVTSITPVSRTQFDFAFDRAVGEIDATKFLVYASDGEQYTAGGFIRPTATVVRVAFPDIQKFTGSITLGAVDDAAAKAIDGSQSANTLASRAIGNQAVTTGHSSGPDLVSAVVDRNTGQVRFNFDELVNDDLKYDAKSFKIITSSGDVVDATSFVEVSGNSVLVNFDRNVAVAASSVTLSEGAVKNFQTKVSPVGTVAV